MEKDNNTSFWDRFLTTGFFSGYSPFAPGTMGALVATIMWVCASCLLNYIQLTVATGICIVLFTLASISPINRLEKVWGEDPSRVVVDEMVGVWICLLIVPEDAAFNNGRYWLYVVAAFALFRLFDIWKPLGVRKMESIGGGWGVMMDDVLAGVYGAIVMMIMRIFI